MKKLLLLIAFALFVSAFAMPAWAQLGVDSAMGGNSYIITEPLQAANMDIKLALSKKQQGEMSDLEQSIWETQPLMSSATTTLELKAEIAEKTKKKEETTHNEEQEQEQPPVGNIDTEQQKSADPKSEQSEQNPTPSALNPKQPVQEATPPDTAYKNIAGILNDVLIQSFPMDKAKLTAKHKKKLDQIVGVLNRHPDLRVLCTGHTCNLGTNELNLRVGQKRADVAEAYLISRGIAANRITTVTRGKNEPLVPNRDQENREKNRRVLFHYL